MDAIVVSRTEVAVVSVGEVGPQGPQGVPGPSGTAVVLPFVADGALGGNRVVRPTTLGKVGYADSATPAHANIVLGITVGAANDGAAVSVQVSGPMTEPSWTWTPDAPVFCGLAGALTQTPPTAGFSLIVGVATGATTIAIGVKQPIALS